MNMEYLYLLTCINAWTSIQVPYKKRGGGEASHLVKLHLKEGKKLHSD